MVGENFKRLNRNTDINRLKDKITELKEQCGKLLNVNEIRDNGFDSEKYDRLSKQIEWNEYLLWGLTEK